MIVNGVRYADGELHIACDPREGVRAAYSIKVGREYDILPHREKRSLTANSYAWVLVHKIAAELSKTGAVTPIEVYRNAIAQLPDMDATFISIKAEAAEDFTKSWENGHIGRQCERISEEDGFVTLRCVYGSSDFSRAEMARFIDALIQDAQTLGIETRDPADVKSLLDSWKA